MEESDEDVDVEDISDGEQISHLRYGTGGDQKNSWYDKEMGSQSLLGSSSCSFSSDYCDTNSWLLDPNTDWSLDNCTDEKSREVIEKMILEEQMYAYRSVPAKPKKSSQGRRKQSCIGRELSPSHRKPWTTDEQQRFEEGVELYGRSWTKIANVIATRTALQVKNFAKQYFKQQNQNRLKTQEQVSQGIDVQCEDSFVLANVEEVTHEIISTEKGLENDVTADLVKDCESDDDDVEVDIDGSDDEYHSSLIPGQTASRPEDVYSALVKAAESAGELSDSANGLEGKSMYYQGSLSDVPLEVTPANSVHLNESASASNSPATPDLADTQQFASLEATTRDDYNSEVKNHSAFESDVADVCEDVNKVANVKDDLAFISELPSAANEENTVVQSTNSSCSVTIDTCHTSSMKAFINERLDSKVSFEPGQTAFERTWIPATCSEVTCSEPIQLSDREQNGASSANEIIPYKEIVIDRNTILAEEKKHNLEFFMGRTLKTPERYMKIRNHILDMWEKSKPCYLFKTAVRSGLKNCGDVNSIGRVHAFLEDIGAINEGCLDRPIPRVRQQDEVADGKSSVQLESWVNSLRPRKKRARNTDDDWVNPSQPEGMTILHLSPDEATPLDLAPFDKGSPSASRKRPSRSKPLYDPFLLVPCRKFPSPSAVPFDVVIQSETLVVMDTHAHMSTTEVIGLLGGTYSHGARLLKVTKAVPCRSLSTGFQCEMDPVSQTQASEDLAHRGLSVVGWYHSHPTFSATPSVRDIETQAKFQEWFAKGGAPFIGIIVSPYNYSNPSNQSQIRCLTVSDDWDSVGQYRLPYQFDYEVKEDEADQDDSLEQIRSIADDYRTYPFRVQLNRRFESSSDLNLLDKLMDSLRSRITPSGNCEREDFLTRIKETISENIKPCQPCQPIETATVTDYPEDHLGVE
ncbi:histone H2A deubiquitinase MYSM1-like [Acropora millepora]|uniref:histone H2A deubiquitinase MYSM1-like n=1 Tax=Acropora millepora TaxID=45264 RepID=UPI001CF48C65|nr:histone H2A deubiquitinase MYSM1-like [Acropora millepora]